MKPPKSFTRHEKNVALRKAIDRGDVAMCSELIRLGADLNVRGKFGETPLHRAASRGNVEV